jgi:thiamine pyrophosphate-dependent acetolactate synthase large subunit-like protein
MPDSPALERRAAVAALLERRPAQLRVVSGLGAPTWDLAAAGDDPSNFYLWGAMGGAATLGLGLALARPQDRVLVLTGDGEMLMGLGSLATIGVQAPANLAIAVIDNRTYGETGGQPSHTAGPVDLPAVARACGFAAARMVASAKELPDARGLLLESPGPVFASIRVAAGEPARALPERDGHALRTRFKAHLAQET